MEDNIIEGNKIIAEFYRYSKARVNNSDELKYHSSWDWLMPVVEKINAFDNINGYNLKGNDAKYQDLKIFRTSIFHHRNQVYERVIEFIKWYKTQQ